MAYLTNFSFELFYALFIEDDLLCLYHGAKKSKMTKNSNQGGLAFTTSTERAGKGLHPKSVHFKPIHLLHLTEKGGNSEISSALNLNKTKMILADQKKTANNMRSAA